MGALHAVLDRSAQRRQPRALHALRGPTPVQDRRRALLVLRGRTTLRAEPAAALFALQEHISASPALLHASLRAQATKLQATSLRPLALQATSRLVGHLGVPPAKQAHSALRHPVAAWIASSASTPLQAPRPALRAQLEHTVSLQVRTAVSSVRMARTLPRQVLLLAPL